MKKVVFSIAAAAFLFVASAYTVQTIINWKIDSEKAMVKFTMQAHGKELIGNFKGAKGEVKFDANDLAGSSVNCTIDISTVNTGMEKRDGHLQAADWFDAATYPTAKFASSKIEKTDAGFVATGKFDLKGTTNVITIPFTYEGTKDAGTFKGTFSIKRQDYKVGKVSDDPGNDVKIDLEIPVVKE
jgi:polyisoprenoid-binding protein YceI